MVAALTLGLIAWAGTPARAEGPFYVVTRECTTTIAPLQNGGHLSSFTKSIDPAEIKRCVRDENKVRCYAQRALGGHLSDQPAHDPDEYEVVSNEASVLQLHGDGRSWMTLNLSTGTVATGVLANSPAAAPEAIDAIASMVCRGTITAPDDLGQLRKQK